METIFTEAIAVDKNGTPGIMNPYLEVRYLYLNYTGSPVAIALRNGLKMNIQSVSEFGKRDFVIRVCIYVGGDAKADFVRQMNEVDEFSGGELKALKKSFSESRYDRFAQRYEMIVDYPVSKNVLDTNEILFVQDCDIVISSSVPSMSLTHPFSQEGRLGGSFGLEESSLGNHLRIEWDLIDNNNTHGQLYLKTGNKVTTISARKDMNLENGLYHRRTDNGNVVTERIDLGDDLLEYGVYKTYQEAMTSGNAIAEMKQKAQILEMETALKEKNTAFQNLKLDNDRKLMEMDLAHQEKLREIEQREKERHELGKWLVPSPY